MPQKPRIINLDDARRKQEEQATFANLLAWMDEIEEAIETMAKAGVTTREELESLLSELEAKVPPDEM